MAQKRVVGMKEYELRLNGNTYRYWYDYHIRMWTIVRSDETGAQLGDAYYCTSRGEVPGLVMNGCV